MKKIVQIRKRNIFADGEIIEYENYPSLDFKLSQVSILHAQLTKLVDSEQIILYEDGTSFILPINNVINVLADKTTFLVIYGEQPNKFSKIKENPWFFTPPNNAAIYNSDGSLKFQLIIPREADGDIIYQVAGSSRKYPTFTTVILNNTNHDNNIGWYSLYAINPNEAVLIPTGETIKF